MFSAHYKVVTLIQRSAVFALVGLVFTGCEPGYQVSASRRIPAPLDRSCIIETLRAERIVRTAGNLDEATIYAELLIPKELNHQSKVAAAVEQRGNESGEQEIVFTINFDSRHETSEYQDYVQKAIEELGDRTIERCVGK